VAANTSSNGGRKEDVNGESLNRRHGNCEGEKEGKKREEKSRVVPFASQGGWRKKAINAGTNLLFVLGASNGTEKKRREGPVNPLSWDGPGEGKGGGMKRSTHHHAVTAARKKRKRKGNHPRSLLPLHPS